MSEYWRVPDAAGLVQSMDEAGVASAEDLGGGRTWQLEWQFYEEQSPPRDRLLAAFEAVFASYPDAIFIGDHVRCLAENPNWLKGMLDRHPPNGRWTISGLGVTDELAARLAAVT